MIQTTSVPDQRLLRIAVADDEVVLRDFWQIVIPRLGYELVGVVSTDEELVQLCQMAAPDMVITDARSPGISGVDAVTAIREQRSIGVVYLTGRQLEDEEARLSEHAVILAKPFKMADVRPAIEAAMQDIAGSDHRDDA